MGARYPGGRNATRNSSIVRHESYSRPIPHSIATVVYADRIQLRSGIIIQVVQHREKLVDSCQTCRSSAIDAPRDNIRRSGLQQSCDISSRACGTAHYCSKHCHQRPSYGPARTQPRNSARARSNIGTSDCCRTDANSYTESDCRAAYTNSRFAADFCAGSHGDTLGNTGRPSIRSRRSKRQGNGFS